MRLTAVPESMGKGMNRNEFADAYPTLSGILGAEFYDGDGTIEEIAARAIEEPTVRREHRHAVLRDLVKEGNLVMMRIDQDWTALHQASNRPMHSPGEAREWLMRVLLVWEKALGEIDGTKPS